MLGFSLSKANAQPELSLEYCKDYTSKQTVRPHHFLHAWGWHRLYVYSQQPPQVYIAVHGTRVAAVPEPLFEAKDVGLRVVDALQKTLKAMQTGEPQPEAPTSGAELKTNFEATNGGGEGPINVKVAVRGVELLVLGTCHPLHFSQVIASPCFSPYNGQRTTPSL